MKYVLIVMYLFTAAAAGRLAPVKFTMDFPTRERCLAALEETTTKVESRIEPRALTVECRPMTPWDEPISWSAYMDDDVLVAEE